MLPPDEHLEEMIPGCSGPTESHEAQAMISMDGGVVEQPEAWDFGDKYATVWGVVLLPLSLITYVVTLVASFPFLMMCAFYAWVSGPSEDVKRTIPFGVFCSIALVAHSPVIFFEVAYLAIVLVVAHIACAPAGLLVRGASQVCENWDRLWPFLSSSTLCPTPSSWCDLVAAIVSASYRQGPFDFATRYPRMLAFDPVLKYLFATNPWIGKLATRHCNQWTEPMKFTSTADEAMILVRHNISRALHRDASLVRVDEDVFAAAYPHPPGSRRASTPLYREQDGIQVPTAIGVDYALGLHLSRVGHAPLRKRSEFLPRPPPLSQQASRLAYAISLSYWNPFHPLTGYVEVNIRPNLQLEHPMWCVLGAGYWPHKFLADLAEPFFLYAPDITNFNQQYTRPRPTSRYEKQDRRDVEASADPHLEKIDEEEPLEGTVSPSTTTTEHLVVPAKAAGRPEVAVTESVPDDDLAADASWLDGSETKCGDDEFAAEERKENIHVAAEREKVLHAHDEVGDIGGESKKETSMESSKDEIVVESKKEIRVESKEANSVDDDDDDDDAAAANKDDAVDFDLTFYEKVLGFSIALRAVKKGVMRIVVDAAGPPFLQRHDELLRIDNDAPNTAILAKGEHGVAHFAALVNRIRQGPRPVTMTFRRHPRGTNISGRSVHSHRL